MESLQSTHLTDYSLVSIDNHFVIFFIRPKSLIAHQSSKTI